MSLSKAGTQDNSLAGHIGAICLGNNTVHASRTRVRYQRHHRLGREAVATRLRGKPVADFHHTVLAGCTRESHAPDQGPRVQRAHLPGTPLTRRKMSIGHQSGNEQIAHSGVSRRGRAHDSREEICPRPVISRIQLKPCRAKVHGLIAPRLLPSGVGPVSMGVEVVL